MSKIYYTHRNGENPFKVIINKKNVKIYSNKTNSDNNYEYLITIDVKKIFIGKSLKNKMTIASDGYGYKFNGNSILLKIDDCKYMFIGGEIFTFMTYDEITTYMSPVGNNDVPYPYAIDKIGNYYLMIENVILKHSSKLEKLISEYDNNPYSFYYNTYKIKPLVKHFKNITEFYIDEDSYDLNFAPNPEMNYNKLIPAFGNCMYVAYLKGVKTELTKENYIKLINTFGKKMKFEMMQKI